MRSLSGALFTAVCCAGIAWAQQPTQPAQQPNRPGAQPGQSSKTGQPGIDQQGKFDADRFLKDHDRNNDGKLSKDEIPQQLQDEFGEVDTNKDGAVSIEELRQHVQRMSGMRPQVVEILYWVIDVPEDEPASANELQRAYEVLRKMDADNNGKLDSGEIKTFRDQREKQRVQHIMQVLDRNNDGKVTKEEARGLWADHFAELDKNNDGAIDKQEVEAACRMKHEAGKGATPGQPGQPGSQPGQPAKPGQSSGQPRQP